MSVLVLPRGLEARAKSRGLFCSSVARVLNTRLSLSYKLLIWRTGQPVPRVRIPPSPGATGLSGCFLLGIFLSGAYIC
jgi:hypothetical protein